MGGLVIGDVVHHTLTLHGMQWIIFSKSTVVHTKMGHVSKTTPLLRMKLEDDSRCGLSCCSTNRLSTLDIVDKFKIGL